MAKKHKNLENILIQWDGDLSKPPDGSVQSSPDNVDLGTWGDNPYTWDDVSFLIEIADCLVTVGRIAREARLHKFDKDTKKRLIHLICRVKGEKVYDEEKVVGDIQIKLEDADLVIKEVLGKMRVENTNVL